MIRASENLVVVECRKCGKSFETRPHPRFGTLPKTCPKCRQSLPTHRLISRERRGKWQGVLIKSLPGTWREFVANKPNAAKRYKIDVSGRRFGASWFGRIVIWADREFGPGDIVDVVQMKATYQVRLRAITQYSTGAAFAGFPGVYYTVYEHLPLDHQPESEDERVFDSTETHEYLVLYPSDIAEPTLKMGWLTAIQKWNRDDQLEIPRETVFVKQIAGTSRTGRHSGQGVLVILPVDAEAKVIRVHDKGALHKGDLIAMERSPLMAEVILKAKAQKPIERYEDVI